MDAIRRSFSGKEDCCICVSPKVGIFILSSLAIFFGVVGFIGSAVALSAYDASDYRSNGWRPLLVLWMIMHLLTIIIRSLLILGVRKDNHTLMFPALAIDFSSICTLIPFPIVILSSFDLSGGQAFALFVLMILFIAIEVHYFLVTYNYYEELHARNSAHKRGQIMI